jgi:hypothetical protein
MLRLAGDKVNEIARERAALAGFQPSLNCCMNVTQCGNNEFRETARDCER